MARRLEADAITREHRPALTSKGTLEEIVEVLAFRTPFYEEVADVAVDAQAHGPADVADLILHHWKRSKGQPLAEGAPSCS